MTDDILKKLVKDGVVSKDQMKEANQLATSLGIRTEEALVKLGYVDPNEISSLQASKFGFETVNLNGLEIPPSVIEMVPESVARENVVIPISLDGDALTIAINDPMKFEVIDKLRFILNKDVKVKVAPNEAIQAAINRHYGQSETESVDSMLSEFTETAIDITQTEIKEAETAAQALPPARSSIMVLVNMRMWGRTLASMSAAALWSATSFE